MKKEVIRVHTNGWKMDDKKFIYEQGCSTETILTSLNEMHSKIHKEAVKCINLKDKKGEVFFDALGEIMAYLKWMICKNVKFVYLK